MFTRGRGALLSWMSQVGIVVGGLTLTTSPTQTQASCSQTLSPGANVGSAVSSAAAGSTVCLGSGNYGTQTFSGIVKNPRVTIRSVTGQGASMNAQVTSGTKGLTFDSLTFTGENNVNGSTVANITFQNSKFDSAWIFLFNLNNSNVLLTNNTHNNVAAGGWQVISCCRIIVGNGAGDSGVTVQNSVIDGGSADGINVGQPMIIQNNEIMNIRETCTNGCHTDGIQIYGGTSVVIRNNYIHNTETGIAQFDGGTNQLIENNVIDSPRPFGIELYADHNSIVRHNTLLYRATCSFNLVCGQIDINTKGASGSGTQIYDNIATKINVASGVSVARRDHNLLRSGAMTGEISGSPTYIGGAFPTTRDGFLLTGGSLGKGGASSPVGSDIGNTFFTTTTQAPAAPTNLRIVQ